MVLLEAAPSGCQVFAQVSLAGLVQVKGWARRDKSHWWRIPAKRLDFVLVDAATLAPRLVVELDDASHDRAERRERDAFLDEVLVGVGIPILHVRCQRRYDVQVLAGQLAAAMGIAAPASHTTPARARPSDGLWHPISVARSLDAVPLPERVAPDPAMAVISMGLNAVDVNAPARRLCGQCQAELREGAKFCSQCGAVFGMG